MNDMDNIKNSSFNMLDILGEKQKSLVTLMTKETILMIFAMIGSLFGLIAILYLIFNNNILITYFIISIDLTINTISLALTWPFTKKYFEKICFIPIKCFKPIYTNKIATLRSLQNMVIEG